MTQSLQRQNPAERASAMNVNRCSPVAPGIALILVGVVALAVQLDWIAASDLGRLWPLALIVAGLWQLWDWWRKDA